MRLSKKNARRIVTEINAIINQKINLMDEQGVIIASTDESRVGSFHEGARKIITENLDELIVRIEDEYEGAREGANFPIIFQDEIVGVIGITGPYDEIVKYGQIIKRMTEILLMEISVNEEKELNENIRNRYISEWISSDAKNINQNFIDRGRTMNIDITVPRRIMIMSAVINKDIDDYVEQLKYTEQSEQYLKRMISRKDLNNIFAKTSSYIIGFVVCRSDDEVAELANQIKKVIEEKYPIRLAIGIDSPYGNYAYAHQSFIQANKALQSCLRNSQAVKFYSEINMEIFVDEISDITKQEYVYKIFKGYMPNELTEAIGILESFYNSEGSITVASQQLHMHKNTLQYKLKKICERTGYDPRSIKYSSLFYNAIYFYRESRDIAY